MGRTTSAGALEWDVVLPERTASVLGHKKPQASITFAEPGLESLSVPVALGRKILSSKEDGTLRPGSRAELVHDIRGLMDEDAMTRLLKMLEHRDYSRMDALDRLRLEGYWTDSAQAAVDRACDLKFINDDRFADSFIRSKLSQGWGIQRIGRELGRRGVDVDEIPGWPESYQSDSGSEYDRALSIAQRHHFSQGDLYPKVVRFLAGRGFDMATCSSVARTICDTEQADA